MSNPMNKRCKICGREVYSEYKCKCCNEIMEDIEEDE